NPIASSVTRAGGSGRSKGASGLRRKRGTERACGAGVRVRKGNRRASDNVWIGMRTAGLLVIVCACLLGSACGGDDDAPRAGDPRAPSPSATAVVERPIASSTPAPAGTPTHPPGVEEPYPPSPAKPGAPCPWPQAA